MSETNIQTIREVNKLLYDVVPLEGEYGGIICNHPYFNALAWVSPETKQLLDLNIKKNREMARKFIFRQIDNTDDLEKLYRMIRGPYKLSWFKLSSDSLSEMDFATYLADAWVTEENPNMDVNVTIAEAIGYFRQANKQYLMDEEDYAYYQALPDELTIYRGVSPGRIKLGLSWTDDLDKARWFMHRFESEDREKGRLYQANVTKSDVLAYFNTRDEAEIVTDVLSKSVKDTIVEIT